MKGTRTGLLWALGASILSNANGFLIPTRQNQQPLLSNRAVPFLTTCRETVSDDTETKEVPLTDVDSRVLHSMLQDSKLDLGTEDDVRKLLERGVVKTAVSPDQVDATEDEDESEYSSTFIKTLSDTKLWRKMSAQASDVLETVSIWVTNKVEQDVKVLYALGFFAWERAVNDVARALPATSSAVPRNFLISNSSSYEEPPPPEPAVSTTRSIMEEMNRPSDEIKSVTRAVADILKGGGTRGSGAGPTKNRGLRTAAPAGSGAAAAERQRRAYTQRKQMRKQERDVTRVPGNLVDTAWELQRELKSEKSPAGYKSAGFRNAIEAGVVGTGNFLQGVRREAQLSAAKRQEQRRLELQGGQSTKAGPFLSNRDALRQELLEERSRITERLQACIEEPENTWLRQDLIGSSVGVQFDDAALRDIVSMMILVRNDLSSDEAVVEEETAESVIEQLRVLRGTIEQLRARSAEAVSYEVADALRDDLLGLGGEADAEFPLIMRLEEAEESLLIADEVQFVEPMEAFVEEEEDVDDGPLPWFAQSQNKRDHGAEVSQPRPSTRAQETVLTADVIEVVPEVVMRSSAVESGIIGEPHEGADTVIVDADELDAAGIGLIAELVTDDDFDVAVGQRTAATSVLDGEEDEEQEENLLVKFSLRSVDVALFVLEKSVTVGIPRLIETSKTVSLRLDEVNRSGMGSKGWKSIRNTIPGSQRY